MIIEEEILFYATMCSLAGEDRFNGGSERVNNAVANASHSGYPEKTDELTGSTSLDIRLGLLVIPLPLAYREISWQALY